MFAKAIKPIISALVFTLLNLITFGKITIISDDAL